jgi:hypothetical protein
MSLKNALEASPPTLCVVAGLPLLTVALLGSVKLAGFEAELTTLPERVLTGLAATLLLVTGLALYLRERKPVDAKPRATDDPTNDPGSWLEMWKVMPPAFVKENTGDPAAVHRHLLDNQELRMLQGPSESTAHPGDMRALIAKDHADGDHRAFECGISWQLELCDPGGIADPVPIITVKKRFEYAKRFFIVGMCLPVRVTVPKDAYQVRVRRWNQLPVFTPVVRESEPAITVPVGAAWHRLANK